MEVLERRPERGLGEGQKYWTQRGISVRANPFQQTSCDRETREVTPGACFRILTGYMKGLLVADEENWTRVRYTFQLR